MKLKLKLAVLGAAMICSVCSAGALAGTAQAGTDARTLCTGVPSNSTADATVCLHAGDAWNWSTAWNQWEWPSCSVEWYATWGYSCGHVSYGHYYNSSGHYNVDWMHYQVNTALTFPGTTFGMRYCANVNINRSAYGGGVWYTGSVWAIYRWDGC